MDRSCHQCIYYQEAASNLAMPSFPPTGRKLPKPSTTFASPSPCNSSAAAEQASGPRCPKAQAASSEHLQGITSIETNMPIAVKSPNCLIDASANACGHFQLSCSFLGLHSLGYSPIGTLTARTYETLIDLFGSQRGIIDPNACVIRHWTHQLPHNQHQFHSPKYKRHTNTHIIITTIPCSYYCIYICIEHLNISRRNGITIESQSITESLWGLLSVLFVPQICWL